MPISLLLDGIVFSMQRQGGYIVCFRELLQRLQREAPPALLTLEGTDAMAAVVRLGSLHILAYFEGYPRVTSV